MSKDLAAYVAEYIREELERGNAITRDVVLAAVDAFEGGAR